MFAQEADIALWREDLKRHDAQRKVSPNDAMKTVYTKPVTWKDVKQKDLEFNPVLQKFAREDKEFESSMRQTETWKHMADAHRKKIERYLPEYNIITFERDQSVPARETGRIKKNMLPARQVDYNIITNQQLDSPFMQKTLPSLSPKKDESTKYAHGVAREFNIISNRYVADHDDRTENEMSKLKQDLKERYNRTHEYDPVVGEYYDKMKEVEFQEGREQKEHGKNVNDKLPPTIKNRETLIFDHTRELPEAIKMLDQKKKEAIRRYEIRYKVEEQMRERDITQQEKTEKMKIERIHQQKFTDHIDRGFDILSMNDYDKTQLSYQPKPVQTKWEKLKLTSSNIQVQQNSTKLHNEKPSLTSSDLKQIEAPASSVHSPLKVSDFPGWKDTTRTVSLNRETKADESDFYRMKEYKTPQQRAKEPVYNLADKYNQYCTQPKKVVDDFKTRTLPQIKIPEQSLKFSMTKTGKFEKLGLSQP